jgi:hypothetical protein
MGELEEHPFAKKISDDVVDSYICQAVTLDNFVLNRAFAMMKNGKLPLDNFVQLMMLMDSSGRPVSPVSNSQGGLPCLDSYVREEPYSRLDREDVTYTEIAPSAAMEVTTGPLPEDSEFWGVNGRWATAGGGALATLDIWVQELVGAVWQNVGHLAFENLAPIAFPMPGYQNAPVRVRSGARVQVLAQGAFAAGDTLDAIFVRAVRG